MRHGSPTPTLEQFKDACRREFSFLFELGYSELQNPDSAEPFKVLFSNGTLTVSIRGENYGQHAGSQLDDIRITALRIAHYCREVLAGDVAKFDAVAKEWRRMTDPKYAQSLQNRKLP